MKLGILGGTFSPVHNGHIRLAQTYRQALGLDQVLLIPTHIPPHKTAPDLPDGEHRCRMAELACEEVQGLAVSDLEQRRPGKSYTVDTLEELHRLYPEAELYLLMGSDMFRTVLTWHRAGDLIRLATVCTMERGTDTPSELEAQAERIRQSGGEACVIHAAPLDVSSSGIRAAIAAGERDPGTLGLSPRVLSYILQNSLYGTDETAWRYDEAAFVDLARRLEKPGRFLHSQNVAVRAEELARIWGEDPMLCRVAGQLHDLCKNLPPEQQFSWLKRLRGPLRDAIMEDKHIAQVPPIWHGPAAAAYIWEELGVYNRRILYGVAYHTTGRAGMTRFEKIIYLADLTSAERDFPGVEEVRELSERDMDAAMRISLEFTAEKMRKNATPATRDTVEIMEEYGVSL